MSSSTEERINNTLSSQLTEPLHQNYEQKDRTFFQRAFSPMHAGAMRGSIFALLASAMGTGVFNLPYRVSDVGVISYSFFVVIAGLFSYIGMYLLSRIISRFQVQSYSEMCDKAYGPKFRKVAQFCIVLYAWGITVCYQVIFAKFCIQLVADTFGVDSLYQPNGGRQRQQYSSTGKTVLICINVGAILLNLVFILKKEIGVLQKLSIIGVLACIFNICVIAVTMFTGFLVPNCQVPPCQYHGISKLDWSKVKILGDGGFQGVSHQFQGFASLIFCFVNHQLLFPLVYDLKNPTKKRMDKIFFRVHLIEVVSYIIVAMAAYLLLVENVPERQINAVVMASIVTSPMSLGKCFLVVSLFFAIPLNLFPARQTIYESFALEKNNKNHIIISLSLAFSGTVIAIFFQNVNSYFGLLGGTAGVMMAGGFPAICYFKIKGLRTKNQVALVVFVGIVSVAAATGAILSVADSS